MRIMYGEMKVWCGVGIFTLIMYSTNMGEGHFDSDKQMLTESKERALQNVTVYMFINRKLYEELVVDDRPLELGDHTPVKNGELESIFEDVRKRDYPNLPSRRNVIYAFLTQPSKNGIEGRTFQTEGDVLVALSVPIKDCYVANAETYSEASAKNKDGDLYRNGDVLTEVETYWGDMVRLSEYDQNNTSFVLPEVLIATPVSVGMIKLIEDEALASVEK